MTRHRALKIMRRLFPSIALREAFARREPHGRCVVGIELRSGEGGARGRRELIRGWHARAWELAVAEARREAAWH